MVSVAQWLEHWTVAPGVGGSSPLTHPNQNLLCKYWNEKVISEKFESVATLNLELLWMRL